MNEELLKDFSLAAMDIFQQVKANLRSPRFLIYGHSMGAFLGLKVSALLENENILPAYLIVSGNAGPGVAIGEKRYMLENDEFLKEVEALGGIKTEFLENQELLDLFIPVLKADFEVAEENEVCDTVRLATPLYAIMGSEEERVELISNWGRFTQSEFGSEVLDGDHFFILNHAERLAEIIKECYHKSII